MMALSMLAIFKTVKNQAMEKWIGPTEHRMMETG